VLGSDTLEPGEGLLEGLQMLVALSFDNCSRRQNFPFLDPAQAVSSHHLSGVLVGIHHAPAAPFVAEFGPGLLEVSGRAAITNPRLAGALLLHPRVAGFLFFGRLLVLPFAVSFVLLAQVPAVDAGEGYVLASREALCLAAVRSDDITVQLERRWAQWHDAGVGIPPPQTLPFAPFSAGAPGPMLAADNEAKVEETPC
jgi:hypothetical protein